MALDLPYKMQLRPYQQPVWDYFMQDERGLRGLTVWPRRNGKDLIALNILVAKAVQRVGLYLYIGPLQTQVRQIIWMGADDDGRKFRDYIPPELIAKVRSSQMEIELINGSMIKLVGSDQYDSLMGLNAVGNVFTEYSLQRPEAWDYIRPMLTNNGGWALFNGTPRGLNHMHGMAKMAEKNEKWFYQYLTRDDTGVPTIEAIKEEREGGMKESKIEQEFYCSWTASTEEVFIPLDFVAPTILPEAELDPKLYHDEPKVFGCDVAYAAKGDKATIICRQGRKVHFVRWFQGKNNMAFAAEIARMAKIHRPQAIFVDGGRGEGVISRLDQLGFDHVVRTVHFGGKVYDEGVANMKALMWLRMEDWFMDPNKPDMTNLDSCAYANEEVEEQLIKEISTPFKIIDDKNCIRVEGKAALKTRGVDSPDLAEGLGLTFAEELDAEDYPTEDQERLGVTADMLRQIGSNATQSYDALNHCDDMMSESSGFDDYDPFK